MDPNEKSTEKSATGPSLTDVLEGHFPLTANRAIFEEIAKIRQRPMLGLVLAPHVLLDRQCIDPLVGVLRTLRGGDAFDLFLDGQAAATPEAWRVVSAIREHFERLTAIVPFAASPGATVLALGADELLMTDVASLSPLEPWNLSPELQRLRGELRALTFNAREVAIQRIDPRDYGAVERAYASQATLVRRVVETHWPAAVAGNPEKIDSLIGQLCEGDLLPSFPFTRRDCAQRLGLDVIKPDGALQDAIWRLHDYYRGMFDIEGDWVWNDRHFSISYDGFIDSLDERRVLVRIHRLDERGRRIGEGPVLTRWVRPGGQEVVIDREVTL